VLNPSDFIQKWREVDLSERSACQQHFLDLCELLEHPKPAEVDKTGESFTFEKGAEKQGGGKGWADVWKKGFFGWEYKKKHADLGKAYDQLLQYREALENPPLLAVCDMDIIEIHTNFTGKATKIYRISLEDLASAENLDTLRNVFHAPDKLEPGIPREFITQEAAKRIGEIAQRLRSRYEDPHQVALFLDRLVFCMFAEDIGLLQNRLFTELLEETKDEPERFPSIATQIFSAMATGGDFGMLRIRHFNGHLFEHPAVLPLDNNDIHMLLDAAKLDWSAVDPSIFGTLFERGLDPGKRAQLGAHYTSRVDIETLVEPVVMDHLRQKWNEFQEKIQSIIDKINAKNKDGSPKLTPATIKKNRKKASSLVHCFLDHLSSIQVLDPACGSGNFLYVTLQKMMDLEKEVCFWSETNGMGPFIPLVHPRQLHGIEINPYAHDLAQMTVWIGYIQWRRANGYGLSNDPILEPLHGNFQNRDAILDVTTDPETPREPVWPEVDYIIGNPPFLGNRMMPGELGEDYVSSLFRVYGQRLAGKPDLCCYWFEKARGVVEATPSTRAGLLATQGIRGGTNRNVLKRIKETGDIFFALADRDWILDGATVHVSMVGFDGGKEQERSLDGQPVSRINANLTSTSDVTVARRLKENRGVSYQGHVKRGPFDCDFEHGVSMLHSSGNPNGLPNSDVILPYVNGRDLTQRRRWFWVIDFGSDTGLKKASEYSEPFDMLDSTVKAARSSARQRAARDVWWLHWCWRTEMMDALENLPRYLVTPRVSKHRLFFWLEAPSYPDCQLIVFSTSDDYTAGILQSTVHEYWARAQGTQLRERESGFRYTPTTCFETFPFPKPNDEQKEAIASAAKALDQLRNNWLNPQEWTTEELLEFPGTVSGPWAKYVHEPNDNGIGIVRYPRIVPRDEECAKKLKKRTPTNLYNERPMWLDLAHQVLDEAVLSAYGWSSKATKEEILERLLELNLDRTSRVRGQ